MIDIKIHEDTVSTVNEFLVSNEQFGDDWREEKTGLNDLLAEVKRLREENRELEEFLNGSHRANQSYIRRLLRAQKWAYKQVLHNNSLMDDYDDYIWGEEE